MIKSVQLIRATRSTIIFLDMVVYFWTHTIRILSKKSIKQISTCNLGCHVNIIQHHGIMTITAYSIKEGGPDPSGAEPVQHKQSQELF